MDPKALQNQVSGLTAALRDLLKIHPDQLKVIRSLNSDIWWLNQELRTLRKRNGSDCSNTDKTRNKNRKRT